jgi:hypothetical protein
MLDLSLWCAAEIRNQRQAKAGDPARIPRWNSELVDRLELELSLERQQSHSDSSEFDHDELTAAETAIELGWSIRTVQRRARAGDIPGDKRSGAWFIPATFVRDITEGLTNGRPTA